MGIADRIGRIIPSDRSRRSVPEGRRIRGSGATQPPALSRFKVPYKHLIAPERGRLLLHHNRAIWPALFLLPYIVIYLTFGLFPVLYSFFLSLTNWDGLTEREFIGLANYRELVFDRTFWSSITNTLLLASVAPFHILIILIVSVMLHSKLCKFRKTAQTIIFLPYITAIVALGVIFSQLFQWKHGIVNLLLLRLNILAQGVNWLGEPWLARYITTVAIQWRFLGYSTVIVMAGLANISADYYEAAEIDGATATQRFLRITLPLLRPILLFMTITTISGSMQLFEIPFMMFPSSAGLVGGPNGSVLTAIWYMFDTAFNRTTRYGYASAITYALFVIMATLSVISFYAWNRKEER